MNENEISNLKESDFLKAFPDTFLRRMKELKSENERLNVIIDKLLNHCDKEGGECSYCSQLICPHGDPLHFHHDSCPSCTCDEMEEYSKTLDPFKDMWELSQKVIERQESKLSQMRKALSIAESALKSCKAHDYFSYYDEDLVKCALSLIASIRNEETK